MPKPYELAASRRIATKALGHPLPPRAEVHHVNGDPRDNRPANLVICQDKAYHMLLHARMKARGYKRPASVWGVHIIRNIDSELWQQVKAKAALEPVTLRDLIERLLKEWLKP